MSRLKHAHTRTHTHTYTHTNTHARTHTGIHAHTYAHTHTRTRTNTHTHTRTHARTQAYTHARTHTYTHTHTHTHTHMYKRPQSTHKLPVHSAKGFANFSASLAMLPPTCPNKSHKVSDSELQEWSNLTCKQAQTCGVHPSHKHTYTHTTSTTGRNVPGSVFSKQKPQGVRF